MQYAFKHIAISLHGRFTYRKIAFKERNGKVLRQYGKAFLEDNKNNKIAVAHKERLVNQKLTLNLFIKNSWPMKNDKFLKRGH